MKRYDLAFEYADKAISVDKKSHLGYYAKGFIHKKLKQYKEMTKYYQKARKLTDNKKLVRDIDKTLEKYK
jgi:tetratricopeptide (TPR) repeat protein